jgi:hypothetical protein
LIRTPHRPPADLLDGLPGDFHGISGPSVQPLREKWTGKSSRSQEPAERARKEQQEVQARVRQATRECRDQYAARNRARSPYGA